jgi:inosine-uridine nucleoside N-ribohydrolase
MQFPPQGKPPVGVIFDTDLGNSIDDALALALLYGLDGKNEARVVSVSISKPNLKAAALAEVIGRFYAGAVSGAFGAVGRTLPIGVATGGSMSDDTPMLTGPLAKKNAEGKLVYEHGIHKLIDTAEVPALIRNAFTSQHDQNCVVVVVGPATNIVKVLDLPGVKDLIGRKVRFLSIMGGAYPDGEPEFNIKADIPAARKLFTEWPTPVVASGFEVGQALLYPGSSIEKDFGWTADHPVADAYRAYEKMPYDTPTWDLSSVLHAIRPEQGYFKVSDPGTIQVMDDGRTKFIPSPQGRHRYLILDPAQKDRILQTYIELVSARPVPRRPRFPRQQQQQQQQPAAPKPTETKPPA